jgi:hypothetical protein
MAPSARAPESSAPAAVLVVLDEIERRWRDALAHVHSGDAARAQLEVEAAERIFAQLGEIETLRRSLDPARLAELADRMSRLSALHHELTERSRSAQDEVVRALVATRQGRAALKAYGAKVQQPHEFDEVG